MRRVVWCLLALAVSALGSWPASAAITFNGHAEYQTDEHGYYYIINGGKFPTGTTPNGDNASGGTFRYLTDDPAWGGYPLGVWQKDDWYPDNAGFALTMKRSGTIVYDNNGIDDPLSASFVTDYYDYFGTHGAHGLVRGYSMSNNFDWIYAGYFKLTAETTVDTIIGYFDGDGLANLGYPAFDPSDPEIAYRMNIWSNVAGNLLPTNTGGFRGDVFTTDLADGTFSVSDTGFVRVLSDHSTDPIWRLTYTLANPVTLQAGEYWFSHDASVVPEPASVAQFMGLGFLLLGYGGFRRFRGRK